MAVLAVPRVSGYLLSCLYSCLCIQRGPLASLPYLLWAGCAAASRTDPDLVEDSEEVRSRARGPGLLTNGWLGPDSWTRVLGSR